MGIAIGAALVWLVISFWWVPVGVGAAIFSSETGQYILGFFIVVTLLTALSFSIDWFREKFVRSYVEKHPWIGASVHWVKKRWYAQVLFYVVLVGGLGLGVPFLLHTLGVF